jgi:hypothetical protein
LPEDVEKIVSQYTQIEDFREKSRKAEKVFARQILFILSLLGTYQLKSDKLKFVILDISKKKI